MFKKMNIMWTQWSAFATTPPTRGYRMNNESQSYFVRRKTQLNGTEKSFEYGEFNFVTKTCDFENEKDLVVMDFEVRF